MIELRSTGLYVRPGFTARHNAHGTSSIEKWMIAGPNSALVEFYEKTGRLEGLCKCITEMPCTAECMVSVHPHNAQHTGVITVFTKEHTHLARRIVADIAAVTEYIARAPHFLHYEFAFIGTVVVHCETEYVPAHHKKRH